MFSAKERCTWAAYPRGGLETRKDADAESRRASPSSGLRARRKEGKNSRENSKEESVRLGTIDVRPTGRAGVGVCADSLGGGSMREETVVAVSAEGWEAEGGAGGPSRSHAGGAALGAPRAAAPGKGSPFWTVRVSKGRHAPQEGLESQGSPSLRLDILRRNLHPLTLFKDSLAEKEPKFVFLIEGAVVPDPKQQSISSAHACVHSLRDSRNSESAPEPLSASAAGPGARTGGGGHRLSLKVLLNYTVVPFLIF